MMVFNRKVYVKVYLDKLNCNHNQACPDIPGGDNTHNL